MKTKPLQIILQLLRRLSGIVITIFSFYYVLVLITFDINDPSFNTFSTETDIKNFGGIFGAKIADLSFQIIGLSSFIVAIFIFSIGLQMLSINKIKYFLK